MDALAGAISRLQNDLDRIERSLVVAETIAALLGEGGSADAQGTTMALHHETERAMRALQTARKKLGKLRRLILPHAAA